MERIEYRNAVFDVVRTLSFERTRVKDAANNYLYTHWDIVAEVHWHPAYTSYRLPAVDNPVAQAGKLPGETDLALLSHLLQPRGLLKITAGDSIILETPQISGLGRMPCDVRGGPSVEAVGVPVMIGTRHWVVTLHITADTRDLDQQRTGFQNAVLSNLWVSTEDIDYQRRSVRRFAGRAILRADVMRQGQVNANSFRDLYLFPCPNHYQRMNVQAQLSEDGTICDWSFEDVMRGYNLGATSPIVDIECFRTGYVTAGSPGRIIWDATRNAAIQGMNSPISTFMGATTIPNSILLSTLDNLPKGYMHCRCDITGDRNAHLGRLTSIALGVCLNQIGLNAGALLTGTVELIFRQDIADQVYTSVELAMRWSDDMLLIGSAINAAAALSAGNNAGFRQAMQNAGEGTVRLINTFTNEDHRTLNVAAGLGVGLPHEGVAADRSGGFYNTNPPMTQGAYGVKTLQGAQNTVPNATPVGTIPAGIEKLIVQALLGLGNQAPPPEPRTLVNQS